VTISGDGQDYLAALSYVLNLSHTEGPEPGSSWCVHEQKNEGVSFRGVRRPGARNEASWSSASASPASPAIALLAAALAFSNFVVRPLEGKNSLLIETSARHGRKADASVSGEKVAAVYAYLQKEEGTTDWLAKLHGIGAATGLQLRFRELQDAAAEGRIERYEIVLPVSAATARSATS
jgi:hypothetical protein